MVDCWPVERKGGVRCSVPSRHPWVLCLKTSGCLGGEVNGMTLMADLQEELGRLRGRILKIKEYL